MGAPFKRQVKPIGAKWLRSAFEGGDRKVQEQFGEGNSNQDPIFTPQNQQRVHIGGNFGDEVFQNFKKNGISGMEEAQNQEAIIMEDNDVRKEIKIIESKK